MADASRIEPTASRPSIRPTASALPEISGAPQVHQQDGPTVAVPDVHQPVVDVLLVRVPDPLPSPRPAHDRQHHVEERDEQDQQRHDQRARDRREVAPARRERIAAHARDRGDRQRACPSSIEPESPMKIFAG